MIKIPQRKDKSCIFKNISVANEKGENMTKGLRNVKKGHSDKAKELVGGDSYQSGCYWFLTIQFLILKL